MTDWQPIETAPEADLEFPEVDQRRIELMRQELADRYGIGRGRFTPEPPEDV